MLHPISVQEAASKNFVDDKFNDPSVIKNTPNVDFYDKNLNNVHSIKVKSYRTLDENLAPKNYDDQAISDGVNESSLLRLGPDEKLNLDEQDSIFLHTTLTLPKTVIKLPTKS